MLFNVDKCKVMHVGNLEFQRQYFMRYCKLDTVSHSKVFGIIQQG